MERLTAEDQLMLWPDEIWPQDVGGLAILDGRNLLEPDGRLRIEVVRRAIAARLHLVPRFRQLLEVPRRGQGRPLWVDAPDFDIADHVREAPPPRPADETALLQAVEQLRRRRLDRSRPLWEMWLLPGLPGHRVGLFVRLHHVVADGVAAVATLGALLDTTPHVPVPPARTWIPAPAPRTSELVADNLRQYGRRVRRMLSTLTRPVTTARRIRAAWPAMRHAFTEIPTPTTSLNHVVGPNRTFALVRSDLELIRRIAHAHDATINDVLLTVTAAGLRGLLSSRGESVDRLTLPVYVPVTLRRSDRRAQARGNLIGQMIIPLPVGTPDSDRRLRQIAAATAERKARPHPPLGTVLSSRIARRTLLKILARHPISVTTADLPGPPGPVYLAGARLLEVFPLLPLIDKVSLGVGALSYAGQFTITMVADADVCPDLDVFAAGAERELRAVAASVS
jgi:WS/DGAT/MGAT family acyltransferase